MVKMIALDLDGTLTSPDHMTVSEANRKALALAHDKGAGIAISTGRTLAIIGDICEQVPQVDYIMYSNGAGVLDRRSGRLIYENLMKWDFYGDILANVLEMCEFIELYADGKSYYQLDKSNFADGVLPKEFVDSLVDKMIGVESLLDTMRGKDIEKITLYNTDQEAYQKMWDYLAGIDGLYLASSLPISMEFTNAGVDKGAALDGICKALGITADECMAFGDAGNDIPMLKYSKYGFAMANASDECKAAAKLMTKSNAEDGVAYGVMQYI